MVKGGIAKWAKTPFHQIMQGPRIQYYSVPGITLFTLVMSGRSMIKEMCYDNSRALASAICNIWFQGPGQDKLCAKYCTVIVCKTFHFDTCTSFLTIIQNKHSNTHTHVYSLRYNCLIELS